MSNTKQLQHAISRTLSKPWQDNGQVWIYSVLDKTLKKENYKTLFASNNIWKREYEALFQESFEDDFNTLVKKLKDQKEIAIWEDYELLLYVFLIHIARVGKIYFGHRTLEEMVKECKDGSVKVSDKFKGLMATAFTEHKSLIVIKSQLDLPYFLTESVVFPFPVINSKGRMELGYAMAIEPKLILALVPKGYNKDHINFIANDATLFNLSLGLGSLDKIAIHPETIQKNNRDLHIIKESIEIVLNTNVAKIDTIKQIEELDSFFDNLLGEVGRGA